MNLKNKLKINIVNNFLKKNKNKNKTKKLSIITQYFPPDFAPTGQLMFDLISNLKNLDYDINVFTGLPAYAYKKINTIKYFQDANLKIFKTSCSRIFPKKYKGRLINGVLFCLRISFQLLRPSKRGDLILITSEPPYLPYFGWLLNVITRTPFVVIIYDIYPDILVKFSVISEKGLIKKVLNKLNYYCFKSAQDIIVLSDPMKSLLENRYPFISDKVNIISSWCDHNKIYPIKKEINWFVKKYNLESKFIVLYSGNQGRCHDLLTIVDAAELLKKEKDIVFLFIGNGAQHKFLTDLIKKKNLQNCLFLEYQEYDNLLFTLNSADLACVTLSKDTESLIAPSKLYGHLAAATPIAAITPDKSYLKKLVKKYNFGRWFNNGDYFDLAKWIINLKENKESKNNYGQRGREYLIKYATKNVIVEKYKAIIERNFK